VIGQIVETTAWVEERVHLEEFVSVMQDGLVTIVTLNAIFLALNVLDQRQINVSPAPVPPLQLLVNLKKKLTQTERLILMARLIGIQILMVTHRLTIEMARTIVPEDFRMTIETERRIQTVMEQPTPTDRPIETQTERPIQTQTERRIQTQMEQLTPTDRPIETQMEQPIQTQTEQPTLMQMDSLNLSMILMQMPQTEMARLMIQKLRDVISLVFVRDCSQHLRMNVLKQIVHMEQ